MKYLDQIDRAIRYIEENLSSDLIIDQIARESGISKWHFQRVFKAVTGETIKSYMMSRKIAIAARELLHTKKKVIDIGLELNFESHEVFTRVFHRGMGLSPGQFRKQCTVVDLPIKIPMSVDYLEHLEKGVIMNPEIKKLGALTIYGVSGRVRPVNDENFLFNFQTVPKIWHELSERIDHIDKSQLQIISTIGCVDENDLESELEYFAAFIGSDELNTLNLQKRITKAGEYAEFIHKGKISNIEHTLNYIYGTWLPRSTKVRDSGPEIYMYPKDYDHLLEDQEVKILIPIK